MNDDGSSGMATPAGDGERARPADYPLRPAKWLDRVHRPGAGADAGEGQLVGDVGLARPIYPRYGLTARQLADAQRDLAAYARMRIFGVGHEQYGELDHQRAEDMSIERLLDEARDEVADLLNYLGFIDLQLQRISALVVRDD